MSYSKVRTLFIPAAAAVILCVASLCAYVTDRNIYTPPNYYVFLPPLVGATYTDPVFGSTIRRVSNTVATLNAAAGGNLGFITNEYSTMSPFNSDNSRFLLIHQSYFGLYDESGNWLRNLPFEINPTSEPRWSRSDRNVLYYRRNNQLKQYNVATGAISVIRTFSEYASIYGMGESDICFDGNHFVFAGDRRYVFVYEISSDTKGPVLDTAGNGFDSLYITPNDNVTITWLQDGTARYSGIELFDRNMNFQRQLTTAGGHMDVTRDTNGDEVLVWTNARDRAPICNNGIVKVRLSDAKQTCLISLDWSLATHTSAPDNSGWIFVETYAPSDPAPLPGPWQPYTNEILQVRLDGSEVRRLAHHRSRPFNRYNYTPRVSVSRDGSKLLYSSNYGLQSILSLPSEYSDAYLISVGTTGIIPPPSSPILALSTKTLAFNTQLSTPTQDGTTARLVVQSVTISNAGSGTMDWTATPATSSGNPWLSVSPASGTGPGTLTVSADVSGLLAGTYLGSVTVASPQASNSPQIIAVSLTVTSTPVPPPPSPVLTLSTETLAYTAQQGGVNPAARTVTISNSGGGTLNWTATRSTSFGGPWLSVSPSSGTAPDTLTVSANVAGLNAGTYLGSVVVSAAGATGSPQTIAVALTVAVPAPNVAPVLALSTNSLTFTAQQGMNPLPQTITISNAGGGTLNWTAVPLNPSAGIWMTVFPTSGTAPATLTISLNIAGTMVGVPGTFQTTVVVAAPGTPNSPQVITVAWVVLPAGTLGLALSPSSLQFFTNVGTNPEAQTFQIQATGGGAFGWTATPATESGGNWLSVYPQTGVAPSTIWAAVNPALLEPGAYVGRITIASSSADSAPNNPQVLLVTLAVGGPRIGENGVVNAASYSREPVVSPGSIASLFGTNLSRTTAVAQVVPLPRTLSDTQLLVNDVPAPLFFVSPTQINFQMPVEVTGETVHVVVVSGGEASAPVTVRMLPEDPGVFTIQASGVGQGAVLNQDSSLNSPQNPAEPGSVIQIFGTGLGATDPPLSSGLPASAIPPFHRTVVMPVVMIGGIPVEVLFSGLAPLSTGLFQINARVPPASQPGQAVPLQIQIGGRSSNTVTIAVR